MHPVRAPPVYTTHKHTNASLPCCQRSSSSFFASLDAGHLIVSYALGHDYQMRRARKVVKIAIEIITLHTLAHTLRARVSAADHPTAEKVKNTFYKMHTQSGNKRGIPKQQHKQQQNEAQATNLCR